MADLPLIPNLDALRTRRQNTQHSNSQRRDDELRAREGHQDRVNEMYPALANLRINQTDPESFNLSRRDIQSRFNHLGEDALPEGQEDAPDGAWIRRHNVDTLPEFIDSYNDDQEVSYMFGPSLDEDLNVALFDENSTNANYKMFIENSMDDMEEHLTTWFNHAADHNIHLDMLGGETNNLSKYLDTFAWDEREADANRLGNPLMRPMFMADFPNLKDRYYEEGGTIGQYISNDRQDSSVFEELQNGYPDEFEDGSLQQEENPEVNVILGHTPDMNEWDLNPTGDDKYYTGNLMGFFKEHKNALEKHIETIDPHKLVPAGFMRWDDRRRPGSEVGQRKAAQMVRDGMKGITEMKEELLRNDREIMDDNSPWKHLMDNSIDLHPHYAKTIDDLVEKGDLIQVGEHHYDSTDQSREKYGVSEFGDGTQSNQWESLFGDDLPTMYGYTLNMESLEEFEGLMERTTDDTKEATTRAIGMNPYQIMREESYDSSDAEEYDEQVGMEHEYFENSQNKFAAASGERAADTIGTNDDPNRFNIGEGTRPDDPEETGSYEDIVGLIGRPY